MKLGFICPNLIGHLNPMTALARHLQDRNHDVVFLYSSGAAGLAHNKTGVVTSLDKLTADHLSTLLDEVLTNSIYRDNARRFRKTIVKTNGLSDAADLVEESLGVAPTAAKV